MKKRPKSEPAMDLAGQLRAAIAASGLSVNQVAERAGIPQPVLQRFVAGERDNLRLDTAGKLAELFGMRLTAPRKMRIE